MREITQNRAHVLPNNETASTPTSLCAREVTFQARESVTLGARSGAEQNRTEGEPLLVPLQGTELALEVEPVKPPNGCYCPKHSARIEPEDIYKAYPVKADKQRALRAISKAMKKHCPGCLLEKTQHFARVRNGNLAYCKYPATFFNAGSFDDDPATWKPRHTNQDPSRNDGQLRADYQFDAEGNLLPLP